MTQTTESSHTASTDEGNGYYAANANLVLLLFDMFQMRPSHFRASGQSGAHGVYYDARKIIDGRTGNRWGHHTSVALKSFCHFTQSENGTLVPWRELVEHREAYDGKEGAGPRTGNRLQTENRLRLKPTTLSNARQQCDLSREQLAEKTALPLRFISALEDGSWGTVTEGTARILAQALNVAEEILFTSLSVKPQSETPGPTITTRPSLTIQAIGILSLVSVFGLLLWAGYPFYNDFGNTLAGSPGTAAPSKQAPVMNTGNAQSSQQQEIVEPVTTTPQLPGCWNWSNGGYVVINSNRTAHNGPLSATWKNKDAANRRYTITWPSFVDTLTPSADGSTLSGTNNYGMPISATRKSGKTQGVEGTWLWGNGITVTIRSDSTVRGGGFYGTWLKAADKWVFEWPLVDTVSLALDGNNLNIINQFGSATAKRDTNCKGS